uniref:Vps16_C domain-containing protein n=1 Tax=Parastrongyloides trichosuri TaxID=131310 RepID=A0A0N4ZYN7_PARTI
MDIRKRFYFDNPEDAYWNENSSESNSESKKSSKSYERPSSSRSFFDDIGDSEDNKNHIASARAALDELFNNDTDEFMFRDVNTDVTKSGTVHTSEGDNNSLFDHNSLSISDWDDKHEISNSLDNIPQTPKSSMIEMSQKTQSISSFSADSTQLDYTRLKSEHKKLQKYLEVVKAERFRPMRPQEIVMRLIKREPVSMDLLRTKEEKMDLIDYGIQYGHQDVIVKILLFLKATLKSSLFREILLIKSEAAKAFICYLYEAEDFEELTNTLYALGKGGEAAMVEFYLASRKRIPEHKVQALKQTMNSGFSDPTLSDSKSIVSDYIDLLERQMIIEMADNVIIKNDGIPLFVEFPKTFVLPGHSLYDTIYYCSLYHFSLPENEYSSPLSIKNAFSIPDKEYSFLAIQGLAKAGLWSDIDGLITTKRLLGRKKTACLFSWKLFFKLVTRYQIPPKVYLEKWLLAIDSMEERKKIANQEKIKNYINIELFLKEDEKVIQERQISGMFAKINKQVEVKKISEAFKSSPIFGRRN